MDVREKVRIVRYNFAIARKKKKIYLTILPLFHRNGKYGGESSFHIFLQRHLLEISL